MGKKNKNADEVTTASVLEELSGKHGIALVPDGTLESGKFTYSLTPDIPVFIPVEVNGQTMLELNTAHFALYQMNDNGVARWFFLPKTLAVMSQLTRPNTATYADVP